MRLAESSGSGIPCLCITLHLLNARPFPVKVTLQCGTLQDTWSCPSFQFQDQDDPCDRTGRDLLLYSDGCHYKEQSGDNQADQISAKLWGQQHIRLLSSNGFQTANCTQLLVTTQLPEKLFHSFMVEEETRYERIPHSSHRPVISAVTPDLIQLPDKFVVRYDCLCMKYAIKTIYF